MPAQPPIGFALVTYRDPQLIYRLVRTLDDAFGDPPITIHHDFGQSPLDASKFSSRVQVLQPYLRTGWGALSTVRAMIWAIESLLDRPDAPRWFYLMTAHCFPLLNGDAALARLDDSGVDVFMEQASFYPGGENNGRYEEWCRRYVYRQVRLPKPWDRRFRYRHIAFGGRPPARTPFSEAFPARAGATYFTATDQAGSILVEGFRNKELVDWYRSRPIVDESLPQTILGNSGLKMSESDDLRYIDWVDPARLPPGEFNPRILSATDYKAIADSDKHVVRKVQLGVSDHLIARISRELLGLRPAGG